MYVCVCVERERKREKRESRRDPRRGGTASRDLQEEQKKSPSGTPGRPRQMAWNL
jgi:glutamyl/glutaminyl-tRNA synthetase